MNLEEIIVEGAFSRGPPPISVSASNTQHSMMIDFFFYMSL